MATLAQKRPSDLSFFPNISTVKNDPIRERKVVDEEIPAASIPVRNTTPIMVGILFMTVHKTAWL